MAAFPTTDERGHPWAFSVLCGALTKAGKSCHSLASLVVHSPFSTRPIYRCAVHGRGGRSSPLFEEPDKDARLAAEHTTRLEENDLVAAQNRANRVRGDIACQKQRMRQSPPQRTGYLVVCPNYKDGGRKYVLGLPALSPKSMGPIDHGQPDLPPALNLENFHQFGKVFPGEYDEATDTINPEFFEVQRAAYLDPVPHRHKRQAPTKGNRNIPLFSIWRTRGDDGTAVLHRISYGASRQFYCAFYAREMEREGPARSAYHDLLTSLDVGYNLLITGYDGYDWQEVDGSADPPVAHPEFPDGAPEGWSTWPDDARRLLRCYRDTSRPFGHELVLVTLLRFPDNPEYWPWSVYRTFLF